MEDGFVLFGLFGEELSGTLYAEETLGLVYEAQTELSGLGVGELEAELG